MIQTARWKTVCLACVVCAATSSPLPAQTFTSLVSFLDGANLFSSLIQGRDGNLYGVSNNGGTNQRGSVFEVTPTGTLSTLYSFCSQSNCIDGSDPFSVLALGTDGNFYGTTQNGGGNGLGTVFKITPNGAYTVIHSFSGSDGSFPDAGLVLGSDRNFYGVTVSGGASGGGTVFKTTTAGRLSTLYSFTGNADGDSPLAPLIQGSDGAFYGTTADGGTGSACSGRVGGCGTVFKITSGGKFSSLHSFNFTDGEEPLAPLLQATSGAFYGTTYSGGDSHSIGFFGYGTIFKITSGGTFSTVHKFNSRDGGYLNYGLIQATDGNLYAQDQLGGTTGAGQIFDVTLPRTLTTLYSFVPLFGQAAGDTALIQATDGKFYATYGAAPSGIFSFDVGLRPFVSFVLPTGKVGQSAQILGQGFTGATSVTFNGVPASNFTVTSDTYLTAVVPKGATTGNVVVTTLVGTLTSNVKFQVTK